MSRPTRLVTPADAPALAGLLRANAGFLAPWEPVRPQEYATTAGQRDVIAAALEDHRAGRCLPHVVLGADGRVAGRVTLTSVVRGAFQSASLGYWVAEPETGRGLATTAVRDILRVAFDELELHRVEAATLLHNVASQKVLRRSGFTAFGVAPQYLKIAGRWQDHALFQALAPEPR